MKITYLKYELHFKRPAGTSRGVYKSRWVWFVFIEKNGIRGIGECAPLPGLSKETPEEVEEALDQICLNPELIRKIENFAHLSSVKFALETALLDLEGGGKQVLFPSEFIQGKQGIPINGLIWMGDLSFMKSQIKEKLNSGFTCLKLKIGALNFKEELELLKAIRNEYSAKDLILRVDANGAFSLVETMDKLKQLSELNLHSIEQPIAAGQWDEMAMLCQQSPLPIAIDEELIGINSPEEKKKLLETIQPHYVILKPSLHGGISGCDEWIALAKQSNIDWWITSYLESNIGLNAISQWAFTKNTSMHQGLGTGQLFINNLNSPLKIKGEQIWFDPLKTFELPRLK